MVIDIVTFELPRALYDLCCARCALPCGSGPPQRDGVGAEGCAVVSCADLPVFETIVDMFQTLQLEEGF